jgi:glycosyltransferase involved in cell wall biosynthesis
VVHDTLENLETIGEAGFAYTGREGADALRSVLAGLLEQPQRIDAYAAKARRRANTVYTWERVTDAYERLFYTVMNRPLPPRLRSET